MKLLRKLRLGKGKKSNKYLTIGAIGLTVIALAWVGPKLIRQKEINQAQSIPASVPAAVGPATLGYGLSPSSPEGFARYNPSLQTAYRGAVSRIGISPYRQKVLA